MDFSDRVIAITGGANGIGAEIASEFKAAGGSVCIIDRSRGEGLRYADLSYEGDIACEAALEAFVSKVVERFGRVDVLINNACLSKRGILSGCTGEDFLYVQRVGVLAPYLLTGLLLEHFSEGAAIVNLCSTRAFMSQADTESYSAAKGGILALTHALAASLGGRVRVNAISPGWIDTGGYELSGADHAQHLAGRVGITRDIARMALYLCSEDAAFITGENIVIDGGMTKRMVYHGDEGWEYTG